MLDLSKHFCLIVVVGLPATACDISRPNVLVMCHNGNCGGEIDPSKDDTLEALQQSLALTHADRPAIDGLEFDFFWYGKEDRCLFAHDVEQAEKGALDASEAVLAIANHLERPGPISWNGERFYLQLELKGQVGSTSSTHTPEQARRHADCALDALDALQAAALRSNRQLEFTFYSNAPIVLRALTNSPRWPGKRSGQQIDVKLGADFSDPTSLGFINFNRLDELTDDIELDTVILHSAWISKGHETALRSFDIDLALWMFSANVEHFNAIERLKPRYVVTSEALLLRRWVRGP